MVARGYTGEMAAVDRGRLARTDLLTFGAAAVFAIIVIGVDHVVAH
jgi:hypothetical protein